MSGIRVSKQYGVNPSLLICPICGESSSIALFGTSYKDANGKTAEAPRQMMDRCPCQKCQQVINDGGIFIIECKDRPSNPANPYRTGRLVAIRRSAVNPEIVGNHPALYMEETQFSEMFNSQFEAK